jgi:lysophospholipase L1-like esterase
MKYLLVLFIAFTGTIASMAQQIRADIPQVDYIHEEHGSLTFPGKMTYADNFYSKLTDLLLWGEGNVHAVHFGGSHIQADIYSNRMRQLMGSYAPNQQGARGLVFPFRIAKTNGPYDYKVGFTGKWENVRNVDKTLKTKLGASGISVYTSDTLATLHISFDRKKNLPHTFKRIKVLHEMDSLSFDLKWLGTDSAQVHHFLEEGYSIIELYRPTDSLEIGFVKTDSLQERFILYGLYLENDEPGITYNSIGVNGASTYSYLKCVLFEEHMKVLSPDIVFFGIGINDAHGSSFSKASFIRNYDTIIERIKRVNPQTFFVFLTNNDSYGYNKKLNTNGVIVQEAMYDLAKKYDGAVWDLFEVMGGLKSANIWMTNGLLKRDRIHFTFEGYYLVGDLLFNALMEGYENYLIKEN